MASRATEESLKRGHPTPRNAGLPFAVSGTMRHSFALATAVAVVAACNQAQPSRQRNGAAINSARDTMSLRHVPSNGVLTVNSGALRQLVVADTAKVVQQLYWIQVEEMLPGKGDAYDYSADSIVAFSGFHLPANFRTYTTPAGAGSDRARAFDYITARGYTIPSGGTRVRLVHLPETPARREVMVVYLESSPRAATDPHPALLERVARGLALVH